MMIDCRTYPRITGSLRAHSNIAEKLHYRGNIDELQRRRQQQSTDSDSSTSITWTELQLLFTQHNTSSDIVSLTKQLRKYAIEFGLF